MHFGHLWGEISRFDFDQIKKIILNDFFFIFVPFLHILSFIRALAAMRCYALLFSYLLCSSSSSSSSSLLDSGCYTLLCFFSSLLCSAPPLPPPPPHHHHHLLLLPLPPPPPPELCSGCSGWNGTSPRVSWAIPASAGALVNSRVLRIEAASPGEGLEKV